MEKAIAEFIIQPAKYFWLVLSSLWERFQGWTKVIKFLFFIISGLVVLSCLMLLVLAGVLPESVDSTINNISSEMGTRLTYVAFGICGLGFIFPFLFIYEASKIQDKQNFDKSISEEQHEKEKRSLNAKIRKLQNTQDKKEALRNYDDIVISVTDLGLTLDERRAERTSPNPINERRLLYEVKNVGKYPVMACRVRMTRLIWLEGGNDGNGNGNAPIEDVSIKWKNYDIERIDLGVESPEIFVLAKISDFNAIPVFHFITVGDNNKSMSEKIPRVAQGAWLADIQIEGQIQNNKDVIDIIPIRYTIPFEFDNYSLIPGKVEKHERE